MTMKIVDPTYFVSEATGEVADPETATKSDDKNSAMSIPPQLPEGVSEQEIRDIA